MTGKDVGRNAATSRELLLADPRLTRDVPLNEFPDLAGASPEKWANYWAHWPIAHLTGTGTSTTQAARLFRLESDRIVPTFTVDETLAVMVALGTLATSPFRDSATSALRKMIAVTAL